MRSVFYSTAALDDLRFIASYIAEDNPDRAGSFVNELRSVVQTTAERPDSFPERMDLKAGLRAARHGRYLISFTHGLDWIQVVRVIHGARDLSRSFKGSG